MSIQDANLILSELVEVDLIDMSVIDGVRTFKMHDWNAHQYVPTAVWRERGSTGRTSRKKHATAM